MFRQRNVISLSVRIAWGCGQGIGVIHDVLAVAELVDKLERELIEANSQLSLKLQPAR